MRKKIGTGFSVFRWRLLPCDSFFWSADPVMQWLQTWNRCDLCYGMNLMHLVLEKRWNGTSERLLWNSEAYSLWAHAMKLIDLDESCCCWNNRGFCWSWMIFCWFNAVDHCPSETCDIWPWTSGMNAEFLSLPFETRLTKIALELQWISDWIDWYWET